MLRIIFLILITVGAVLAQTKDDPRPVVDDSKTTPATVRDPKLPTLWIVGDSTLNSNAPLRGWGQELAQFFDQRKINVVNRAIGGRSSRTFQNEGRWDKVLAEMKPGDLVLIQFGHNDVGRYDDPAAKERPSLHGEGDDTVDVTKKDGSKETVHTFGWYMRKYGTDARAKGASAIFCSMVPHKDWENGKIVRKERETFVEWTKNAAVATGAAFIDLNESAARRLEALGPEKVQALFGDARTHSTPAGALLNAETVVAGLKALKRPNLSRYFSEKVKPIEKTRAFVIDAPKAKVVSKSMSASRP